MGNFAENLNLGNRFRPPPRTGAYRVNPLLIKKHLPKVQGMRASLAVWGLGARLRAPVGSRGKAPGGGPGGEALGSSRASQYRNRFPIYVRLLRFTSLQTIFFTQVPYTQHAMPIIDAFVERDTQTAKI